MSAPQRPTATKKGGESPFERLLGAVPIPQLPAGTDYRDVSDAMGDAVCEAAKLDPDRFFAVLAEEPSLSDRGDVVWALGYVKDPRVVPPLIVALRSKLDTIRWSAANGLGLHRDASAVDPLIAALRDRSPQVRRLAIQALQKQGSPRAVGPLREALSRLSNKKDPSLVEAITQALEKLDK